MDNATQVLIAIPEKQATAVRQAAAQWDADGASTMFLRTALQVTGDPSALFVFSFGWISNDHLPDIQAAALSFPDGKIIFSYSFDDALNQAGLERVPVTPP